MDAQHFVQKISCGRCQSKKVRCNRVAPRCDKCEAVGAECIYSPRKPRSRKIGNETSDRRLLMEILDRLGRLEDHCFPGNTPGTDDDGDDAMSISSASSGTAWATPRDEDPTHVVPSAIRDAIRSIKDESNRSILLSSVFCHLKQMQSCFFNNSRCIQAITSAISEIDALGATKAADPLKEPIIPKDLAKKLIETYYIVHPFEGFKYPLEKSFLAAIPELSENPHVQLDCTSQVVYYSILLRGLLMDPEPQPNRATMIQNVYRKSVLISDEWMKNVKDTDVDLLAASSLISTALEGCDIELSWKAFGHACSISRALGYFSVDENPNENPSPVSPEASTPKEEDEVEKNRKRFGFWHILRTDCLFRLSFGKPTLMPAGSWRVNFPDPTITGVDDESSRYIQIHFLSSMRLALTSMRYFDWMKGSSDPDPVSHDAIVDRYIDEVQSILSDWDTESLLREATNTVESWLCIDVLFSSYKMLIILYQSKKSSHGHILPYQAVDLARKSIKITKSLLGSSSPAFWGISLISLHQIVPFFTLFLDILGNPNHENFEEDLLSINWVCDYVEMVIDERTELKPVVVLLKTMADACQQAKMDRLVPQVASFE